MPNLKLPIYYLQNFGGGGVGLGLLLGPIGAAMNASSIDEKTELEAGEINGKLDLDPVSTLNKLLSDSGKNGTDSDLTLNPYIFVIKGNEEGKLYINAMIQAVYEKADKHWVGRYGSRVEFYPMLEQLKAGLNDNDQAKLKQEAIIAFSEALELLHGDLSHELRPLSQIHYETESFTPRISFPLQAKLIKEIGDEIVILTPGQMNENH